VTNGPAAGPPYLSGPFDAAADYDAQLNLGLRVTGEDKKYFVHGRLEVLRRSLPSDFNPTRILDYGCGTGYTTGALAQAFETSFVTGADTSENALDLARREYPGPRIEYCHVRDLAPAASHDLCYVNGVFHHIRPEHRRDALATIRGVLSPGAYLALFENNPRNPGTRLVMKRIPFDRDARLLSPAAVVHLLRNGGFRTERRPVHLFFFPAFLRFLRRFEPALESIPLGGQYLVLARLPSTGRPG